jgi:hypothetical protein
MYHYKAIPFAEYKFGPCQPIIFVILLFESQSKHYLECYFQVCICRFATFILGISEYLNNESFDRKYDVYILALGNGETSEIDSKGQITPSCNVICTCIGATVFIIGQF